MPGINTGYPWDEWLDGSVWRLTPKVDFPCSVESFRSLASKAANIRHGKITTRWPKREDLYIQFVKIP